MFQLIFNFDTLVAGLHIATPILLAALGGAICMKTGVFNIALEGLMIIGAFTAAVAAFYLKDPYLGILGGMLVSALFALVFGIFYITLGADPIIAGLALNMFAGGMTTWLLISTKPKPLDWPVSRSLINATEETVPAWANRVRSSSSVVE